jgi:hypothetical protein
MLFDSDSFLMVNVALNVKLIQDFDVLGEIVQSRYKLFAIVAETLYFEKLFFAVIVINCSLPSDIFIS